MAHLQIPEKTTVVAAVKYATEDQIQKLIEQEFHRIGWSTVQQFLKIAPLLPTQTPKGTTVTHDFIGHLQTNKIKQLLLYDIQLIHSVDREKVMAEIEKQTTKKNQQKILLQIRTDEEKSFGFSIKEVEENLDRWREKYQHIEIIGLMTIPPDAENPEESRLIFRTIKKLASKLKLPEISMGMSSDYQIAIEEGATIVRLGRILFQE